jgi:PAS domain S-box-containing protein
VEAAWHRHSFLSWIEPRGGFAVIATQGLQGIAFFQATACLTLLVLFIHLKRDNPGNFYTLWLAGWVCLTLSSFAELALFFGLNSHLHALGSAASIAALVLFLGSVVQFAGGPNRFLAPMLCFAALVACTAAYYESSVKQMGETRWETAFLQCAICLGAGWFLWRSVRTSHCYGGKLLAGAFVLLGLNTLDRPHWVQEDVHLLRFAFDHFLNASLGIGMIVLLLETARTRSEEISEKMRQFTMLTASSSQSVTLPELLQKVVSEITSSLGASHGMIRLIEGEGNSADLVITASVGFSETYLKQHERFSIASAWMQELFQQNYRISRFEEEKDTKARRNMADAGINQLVAVCLRGKKGPVGLLNIGVTSGRRFHEDEIAYLANVANFLGTTVENVNLFEQVKSVTQQWVYTFDSIGDPILVHDEEGKVLRGNLRLADLLGRDCKSVVGRNVSDLLNPRASAFNSCPYCEGVSGEGDAPDPWLHGFFLASNSTFSDPDGRKLGTIHVLKDITERKRAEEKYSTLVASVQEGVFITTLQGRFLDFNAAFMRITGYDNRDELMQLDIPTTLYVNAAERDRLKKLLSEHGAVNDFEFEIRRKDGEVRTVSESSTAVRDSTGNVTAYQGFLLDVTERRRAEQQIRRRNRELLVLNSIVETLVSSLDLNDSIQRTLRQIAELFSLDVTSLYLFEKDGCTIRRVAAVGHRSEYGRDFPPVAIPQELIQQIRAVRAPFLSIQGLPLPPIVSEIHKKEGMESAYIVTLWSKDKIIGALGIGNRARREFSAADISLLIAVGSQVAGAVERSTLYEEARQAYENLRRAQEQLLHSEKLAAVGQLISGVAHELNNPLTAILGYSQLLTASGEVGPLALSYSEKLYKQAQRTHRIVQNLLSFARQHKPERVPVQLNGLIEDTLALRDYDLRMREIRVHLDLSPTLPHVAADPHQLQQVFLNLINNAVDAILENGADGDLWVSTGIRDTQLFIEFTDSGPGVKDASRVFDPFYTTKPVGKGTGLGLSICYGIITEHGGTILVRNAIPKGATFSIELPLQPNSGLTIPKFSAQPDANSGARILIIDGDDSILETAAALLQSRDYAVQTAKSFSEGKRLLAKGAFDLVLADWSLAVEENSRGRKKNGHPPDLDLGNCILWMIAPGIPKDGIAGPPAADIPILQKPFQEEDLFAAVQNRLLQLATPLLRR